MTATPQTATAGDPCVSGRPAIVKDATYWARIKVIVDAAPELSVEQRVRIRAAIHRPGTTRRAAA